MGSRSGWLVVGMVALALAGAWQYRDRLKAHGQPALAALAPATPGAAPQDQPDVLYSWVDKDGVTHYEQQSGRGQRVEFDGSRITPLTPVDPDLAGRVRTAAGSDTVAASTVAGEATGAVPGAAGGPVDASAAPSGGGASGTLGRLRQELQVQARKMQQAKASRDDL